MFKLTERAAEQVFHAAKAGNMQSLALRLAAHRLADGSIEYGMGFDEAQETDVHLTSHGVDIVFDSRYKELLQGTVMDFVELEPDDFRFIFLNPNDAGFVPPEG